MSAQADRALIAARLRGLLAGHDDDDLGVSASRLGVSEVALRMSVDDLAPHPVLDVIIAIVREQGVDPCWLITGEYSAEIHRRAVEASDAGRRSEIAALIAGRLTPSSALLILSPNPRLNV